MLTSEFEDQYTALIEGDPRPSPHTNQYQNVAEALLSESIRAVEPGAPFAVTPESTVMEAVMLMNEHHAGCVVVVHAGKLVGIFTERDVLRRVVPAGRDPQVTRVADVMTKNVHTISPETTVNETMALFAERKCRHIPVVEAGQLKGLISIGDISRWVADSSRAEADHLKNYIAGGWSG